MTDALLTLLVIGAVLRLTRFLTADTITERPRSWMEGKLPDGIAYVLRCDWCMSMHVGFAVFTAAWFSPVSVVWIVSGALTASLIAGWMSFIDEVITEVAFEFEVVEEDDEVFEGLTDEG